MALLLKLNYLIVVTTVSLLVLVQEIAILLKEEVVSFLSSSYPRLYVSEICLKFLVFLFLYPSCKIS